MIYSGEFYEHLRIMCILQILDAIFYVRSISYKMLIQVQHFLIDFLTDDLSIFESEY